MRSLLRRDLDLIVYPVEVMPRFAIRPLAEYLAQELAPELGIPAPVGDPYEGGKAAVSECETREQIQGNGRETEAARNAR